MKKLLLLGLAVLLSFGAWIGCVGGDDDEENNASTEAAPSVQLDDTDAAIVVGAKLESNIKYFNIFRCRATVNGSSTTYGTFYNIGQIIPTSKFPGSQMALFTDYFIKAETYYCYYIRYALTDNTYSYSYVSAPQISSSTKCRGEATLNEGNPLGNSAVTYISGTATLSIAMALTPDVSVYPSNLEASSDEDDLNQWAFRIAIQQAGSANNNTARVFKFDTADATKPVYAINLKDHVPSSFLDYSYLKINGVIGQYKTPRYSTDRGSTTDVIYTIYRWTLPMEVSGFSQKTASTDSDSKAETKGADELFVSSAKSSDDDIDYVSHTGAPRSSVSARAIPSDGGVFLDYSPAFPAQ